MWHHRSQGRSAPNRLCFSPISILHFLLLSKETAAQETVTASTGVFVDCFSSGPCLIAQKLATKHSRPYFISKIAV
ncbi:hypothetical protein IAS59_005467 [Cryptococcus gattii]